MLTYLQHRLKSITSKDKSFRWSFSACALYCALTSQMEWQYDVSFTFFCSFHIEGASDLAALRAAFRNTVLEVVPLQTRSLGGTQGIAKKKALTTRKIKAAKVFGGGDNDYGDDDDEDSKDDVDDDEDIDDVNDKEKPEGDGNSSARAPDTALSGSVVLRVVRCGLNESFPRAPGGLSLTVGDEIMVCRLPSKGDSPFGYGEGGQGSDGSAGGGLGGVAAGAAATPLLETCELLDVGWGSEACGGLADASAVIFALRGGGSSSSSVGGEDGGEDADAGTGLGNSFVVRMKRPLRAPLDRRRDLTPAMTAALKEWDRRCASHCFFEGKKIPIITG